ncbi:MAG: TRAP transporter substrate-binding protein [Chitinophagales bacterium]
MKNKSSRSQRRKASKSILTTLLIVSFIFILAGCSKTEPTSGTKQQSTKTVELKLAHFWPATHPAETQLVQPWAKEVEKATNGRVKITSYPGETLLKAADIYDGVEKGVTDIGISCFSYSKGRFPVCEGFELPGITYSSSKAASKVAWEGIQQLNPKEVQDTHLLMVLTTGPGDLYTKKPVKTLKDLQGMEIRATGISAETLSALGATPIGMPQSEAYEALSKGMVKGNLGPDEVLKGWKQAEVTKYITKSPFLYNTLFFVTMNNEKWNALSPKDQKIFQQITEKYFEDVAMGLWDKQNAEALKWAVNDQKMEVINLSDQEKQEWIDRVTPVQQEYVQNLDKQGLNGQKTLDRIKELAKKYNQQYK